MNSDFVLDPTPTEWIDDECNKILIEEILPCSSLLEEAKMLKNFLKIFIKSRINSQYSFEDGYLTWARDFWGHRLDQLFLEYKDALDQASCKLIRVSKQGLAFELYHRLCMEEATFEDLSIEYGEGTERFQGGLFKLQNMEDLPSGIEYFLRKLEVGETTKPLSINNQFAILQLTEFVPAVRSTELEQRILKRQFQFWLNGMSDHLLYHLNSLKVN